MAPLKRLGDLAELRVAADPVPRGFRVLFPYGEDSDYDLAVVRPDGRLERVQVKYHRGDGATIKVRCLSVSVTNGKIVNTKHYTAATVDWLAVYDATTDCCYYVPSSRFDGHSIPTLRVTAARNNQTAKVNLAGDFLHF